MVVVIVSKKVETKSNLNINVISLIASQSHTHTPNNSLNKHSIYANRLSSFSTSNNAVVRRNPPPVDMENISVFEGLMYKRCRFLPTTVAWTHIETKSNLDTHLLIITQTIWFHTQAASEWNTISTMTLGRHSHGSRKDLLMSSSHFNQDGKTTTPSPNLNKINLSVEAKTEFTNRNGMKSLDNTCITFIPSGIATPTS